jgi:drug/metabolite transporter (DMT)-like permease
MKREEKIGALLGIVFGCFSFINLFMRVTVSAGENEPLEFFLFIVLILFYAIIFGRRAGRIINKRRPIMVGFVFVFLTHIAVFLTFGIGVALIEQNPDTLLVFLLSLFFSLLISAIPILITAVFYGYTLRYFINNK